MTYLPNFVTLTRMAASVSSLELCVAYDQVFPYCGFAINTETLELRADYSRASVSGTFALVFSLTSRCRPVIFSSLRQATWTELLGLVQQVRPSPKPLADPRQLENRNHVAYVGKKLSAAYVSSTFVTTVLIPSNTMSLSTSASPP